MGSVLMKIVASYTIAIFFIFQVGASRAVSWNMKSFDEIVESSEVIGIFSDFSYSRPPSEGSGFFVIRAQGMERLVKGSVDGELSFCARDLKDFQEDFDTYLLFLEKGAAYDADDGVMACDYFLRTFEQNAYPVADYRSESSSFDVLVFRSSGIDGEIESYDLHSTLQDIFMSVKFSIILNAIDDIEKRVE